MKTFNQWNNKRQFIEFDINPNAPAIPASTQSGLDRGASPPIVPVNAPSTQNPADVANIKKSNGMEAASAQPIAVPKVSQTVLGRIDWLIGSLETLSTEKIIEVQRYLMTRIQASLAQKNKAAVGRGARAGLNAAKQIKSSI